MDKIKLISFDFQVFGKVQGVFFRKYTQIQANQLKLVGWVQNEDDGSVTGCAQGEISNCNIMMKWLKEVGSPKSKQIQLDTQNCENDQEERTSNLGGRIS